MTFPSQVTEKIKHWCNWQNNNGIALNVTAKYVMAVISEMIV